MAQKIRIGTDIHASQDKVWDYYTLPEHIVHWNFASGDWHCPSAANDMQVDGKYNARMEAKDGSFGFDFEATYTHISEGEEFTYVLGDGREITVRFAESDGLTKVDIVFDAEDENPIEMQKDGWQAILNNFKNYVETNPGRESS